MNTTKHVVLLTSNIFGRGFDSRRLHHYLFSINSLQRKQDFVQSLYGAFCLCSFYRFSWWADELLIATEKHLGRATGMTADHYSCSSCLRLQRVLTTELS